MQIDKYYERISSSMCDFEAFYKDIAANLPDNSVIAEVGVADGYSALFLAHHLQELGKTFTMYMIDNMDYGGVEQLNTIINHVIEAGIKGIKIYPYSGLEAARRFPDYHFDFVFIDSSHLYPDTRDEILAWYPRIKEEGILAGHDYHSCEPVRRSVDEVIPEMVTRDPIRHVDGTIHRTFKPEPCRRVYETTKGFGVWSLTKRFYINIQ